MARTGMECLALPRGYLSRGENVLLGRLLMPAKLLSTQAFTWTNFFVDFRLDGEPGSTPGVGLVNFCISGRGFPLDGRDAAMKGFFASSVEPEHNVRLLPILGSASGRLIAFLDAVTRDCDLWVSGIPDAVLGNTFASGRDFMLDSRDAVINGFFASIFEPTYIDLLFPVLNSFSRLLVSFLAVITSGCRFWASGIADTVLDVLDTGFAFELADPLVWDTVTKCFLASSFEPGHNVRLFPVLGTASGRLISFLDAAIRDGISLNSGFEPATVARDFNSEVPACFTLADGTSECFACSVECGTVNIDPFCADVFILALVHQGFEWTIDGAARTFRISVAWDDRLKHSKVYSLNTVVCTGSRPTLNCCPDKLPFFGLNWNTSLYR